MCTKALLLALLAALPLRAGAAELPRDRDNMLPSDVVRLQLEALQANDDEDTGIARVWEYTSPRNRAANGPYARFVQMIHAGFGDMLQSRDFRLGEGQSDAEGVQIPVRLTCAWGNAHGYIFLLSREHPGDVDGLWRTEGVIEIDLGDTPPDPTPPAEGGWI